MRDAVVAPVRFCVMRVDGYATILWKRKSTLVASPQAPVHSPYTQYCCTDTTADVRGRRVVRGLSIRKRRRTGSNRKSLAAKHMMHVPTASRKLSAWCP